MFKEQAVSSGLASSNSGWSLHFSGCTIRWFKTQKTRDDRTCPVIIVAIYSRDRGSQHACTQYNSLNSMLLLYRLIFTTATSTFSKASWQHTGWMDLPLITWSSKEQPNAGHKSSQAASCWFATLISVQKLSSSTWHLDSFRFFHHVANIFWRGSGLQMHSSRLFAILLLEC